MPGFSDRFSLECKFRNLVLMQREFRFKDCVMSTQLEQKAKDEKLEKYNFL